MSEFSFLDYLDDYSHENLLIIERAAQLKNRDELARIAGISSDTLKGWFTEKEGKRKRNASTQTWNLLLYTLEAKRKGYSSIKDIFKKV